jgi:hypothetical protein
LTWPAEVEYWTPFQWMKLVSLRTEEGRQSFLRGDAQLYVVNYESLHYLTPLFKQRKSLPFDTIIWDEIDTAKSQSSKRINRFRRDIPRVKRNWGQTGTPADKLMDLFAQFRLLDGGQRLGRSFTHFRDTYFTSDFMGYVWTPNEGAKEAIEKRIADITLTLRAKDWMPEMTEAVVSDIDIVLPDDLKKKYRQFERDLILQLGDGDITAANAAVLVGKLLQFTSGATYDEDRNVHVIHDKKLEALDKLRKQHKTLLVACQYQHEQDRMREKFPMAKFFQDAKTIEQQTKLLADWNARKVPMLIAHPKSMSHGLNMQGGGCNLVWTSLTYSRRRYDQMIARLARRGQKELVTVHRLMCSGTVDDAVASVLESKRDTEDRLLAALSLLESVRDKKIKIKLKPIECDWI